MGRSDLVRRAMSKKKHDVMEKERKNFVYGIVDEDGKLQVPGCVRNNIDEKIANKIFDSMIDFASYAFNKSHAAAYAVIAFQTGYLMRYYPTECIAAMLNSVMGNSEKVAYYTRYAKEEGMEVFSPNINESYGKFTVKGNKIRFGLAAIKNVGLNAIENIVDARNKKGMFINLEDFCTKVDLSCINKRTMESLIKAGAFDSFNIFRSRMLAVHEKILDSINNDKKKNIQGQVNLFDDLEESSLEIQYPNINEFDKKNILSMEKEMTGLYLSGHPLDEYKNDLKKKISINISDIVSDKGLEGDIIESERKVKDGEKVIIGGIITNVNKKVTRSNEMMAFIEVEDLYGTIEVIIFPRTLSKYKEIIFEDQIIILKGRVSLREGEAPKLISEDISPFCQYEEEKRIYVRIEKKSDLKVSLNKIRIISNEHLGGTPIYLYIEQVKQTYKVKEDLWVKDDIKVIDWIKTNFGNENVKVI